MRGIKEFLAPTSLDETIKLLDANQNNSIILAGGTHLALVKTSTNEVIIDIKQAGLSYIDEEGENIRIGATTRMTDIIKSEILSKYAGGLLNYAASKVGSVLTKNLVTIGGNIYSLFPWSNIPPALLVLDASVELISSTGVRKIPLKELIRTNPKKCVNKNELIASLILPISSNNLKTAYKTFALTENDYDIAIVAVALEMENNICKKAKIAVGAAIWPCDTICEAGKILQNKPLDSALIEEVAQKVASSIKLIEDFRTTDEHRISVVKTLVKRSLEECKG